MGEKTEIEWTDSTWNPLRGTKGLWSCTKVSEGCQFCYAERFNRRLGGPDYKVGADTLRLDDGIMEQPLRWKRPRRIFVCSMTDLFEERVPDDWIYDVWLTMLTAPQHTYQILTKRAERMAETVTWIGEMFQTTKGNRPPWPLPNVQLGVSTETQEWADKRIPFLLKTPAAVRFLSVEPLLGSVDVEKLYLVPRWMNPDAPDVAARTAWYKLGPMRRVDWVIVGGESGGPPERALVTRECACGDYEDQHDPDGRCRVCPGSPQPYPVCKRFRFSRWSEKPEALEWVRSLRDQCLAASVPFFFKQWGGPTPKSGGRLLDGKEWSEWPK